MSNQTAQKSLLMQIIDISLRLFLITTVVVLLLSVVNYFTAPVISSNSKKAEIKAMRDSFNNATFSDITNTINLIENPLVISVNEAKVDNVRVGFSVKVVPKGYGGEIGLLCSMDDNGAVVGIKVISAAETPGIGTKVLDQSFLESYKGYKKDDKSKIISGATITSKGISNGVNAAIAVVLPLLSK